MIRNSKNPTKDERLNRRPYTCVVCDSTDIEIFMEIPQVPVYCNVLWPTREAALNSPMADMQLGFCRSCGHIYNFAFDPAKLDYTLDYENSLHFSPRFQEYARTLADRLITRHNLYAKDIIEIGCGSGDFLKLLCEMGGNRGVGFDPSSAFDRSDNSIEKEIIFVKNHYSEHYAGYKADLICCRHVLEHIQSPLSFLRRLRRTVDHQTSTVIFFEVPNVLFSLRDQGIWDLIYEHCSYFTGKSLAEAFTRAGFTVTSLTELFEGQFLNIEACMDSPPNSLAIPPQDHLEEIAKYVQLFHRNFTERLEFWRNKVDKMAQEGRSAVIWGAGSKGVMFLNALEDHQHIQGVIDINPNKQGKYIAGTGQRILPPESLRESQPDVVIVMNPIYITEIRLIVEQMRLASNVISV